MQKYDAIVVGAGIVGAATALKLKQEKPTLSVLVVEKEAQPAMHQTGRNSGVIHAGVYYQPGSLKAQYCREGLERTIAYCQQYDLPYLQCGKLLVATNAAEVERMHQLYARCEQNYLQPEMLTAQQLQVREPNVAGKGAFFVKQSGITDYVALTRHMLAQFEQLGGQVCYNTQILGVEEQAGQVTIETSTGSLHAGLLINCAGLQADRLARNQGLATGIAIVPFKGEYYLLPKKYNQIVKHLIYPIPDPELPFLGVHLTRMVDGTVTVGPNAVLAGGREEYSKAGFNLTDIKDMLAFPGFSKVIWNNLGSGIRELKNSWFKAGYLKQVQKYCPQIQLQDLLPYRPGIRAQAVSKTGELVHDFVFIESARSLHIGNAPSPAATSAMPIADAIYEKLAGKL